MSTTSPFLVHVGDLLGHLGERRSHQIVAPVEWGVELSRTADIPLVADLELVAGSGGLLVRGEVEAAVIHTCPRCLEEWAETRIVEVAEVIETGADDGDYVIQGDELDLEPVVRDAVMLAMPLLPVCPAGCEGLVAEQESDLNTALPEDRPESPFAALQDLFEPRD